MISLLIPSKLLILQLLYSTLMGALIFYSLTFSGQRWAANNNFMLTCFLLPSISFIITKAISGNIALSLGMVGALSIVRFRHPVKSPFELSIFFLLVTLGISINSSISGSVALTLLVILIMFFHNFINKNPLNISLVPTGFTRLTSENVFILEVLSSSSINEAYSCDKLIMSDSNLESSRYCYKFSFNNLNELNMYLNSLKKDNNFLNIQIDRLT